MQKYVIGATMYIERKGSFVKRVLGCIRRADERYSMIHDGDKICVGVSGGKDSLLLMYALKLYQRFCKKDYEVCGVMLDLGIVPQETERLEAFAHEIDVPLDIIKTDIGDVVFNIRKESHPCALCATLRRGALNNAARDRGCNLVALGHNREDVVETFLMSLFYESRLNTMAPVTHLDRSGVTVIRPLVFFPEMEAIGIAKRLNLPVLPANCPVAGDTKREEMKNLIKYLRTVVKDADTRIMTAIADVHKYGMWDKMKLPPEATPTAVSRCLLGERCRYNGEAKEAVFHLGDIGKTAFPICPECMAGLEIPREPCEIVGGDGYDVLDGKARVMSRDGKDRTVDFIKGAYEALLEIQRRGSRNVILKSNSPSCGCGKIYDGTFSGTLKDGDGVTTALLKRHGITVKSK